MKRIFTYIIVFLLFSTGSFTAKSQCTTNYLVNGDFETPVQTVLGNNFPVTVTGWTFTAGTGNLIKVNGSNYYGGPNTANSGTQYLDIVSANGSIEQNFTLSCASSISFRGAFSSREVGRNWTAVIQIVNSSNVVVASSTIRNFTTADADNNPPGADAVWYTLTGSTSLAAGTYKFRVPLDDYGNFDNAYLCALPGCILPLRLVSFDVSEGENCKNILHWITDNELNVNRYEIEYSFDGIHFNFYKSVKAKNLFTGTSYTLTANIKTAGPVYFRLKMIDENLQYKYSAIVKFTNSCSSGYGNFSIQSNIVSSYVEVNVNSSLTEKIIQLFNSQGQLVLSKTVANGFNRIDISKLAAGVYFIKTGNSAGDVKKVVKVNEP